MLTQEELKRILHYDPGTGAFTWLITPSTRKYKGDKAGTPHEGYNRIYYKRHPYYAHRLAFLYMTGKLPIADVDHINGDRGDDSWINLREATRSLNASNRKSAYKNSESGLLGVSPLHGGSKPWRATILVEGKKLHLGCFDSKEEAHAYYLEAKRRLHSVD